MASLRRVTIQMNKYGQCEKITEVSYVMCIWLGLLRPEYVYRYADSEERWSSNQGNLIKNNNRDEGRSSLAALSTEYRAAPSAYSSAVADVVLPLQRPRVSISWFSLSEAFIIQNDLFMNASFSRHAVWKESMSTNFQYSWTRLWNLGGWTLGHWSVYSYALSFVIFLLDFPLSSKVQTLLMRYREESPTHQFYPIPRGWCDQSMIYYRNEIVDTGRNISL